MIDDQTLKQLAKDLYAGKIFTSDQISNPDMIPSVFMVLNFIQSETKAGKEFLDSKPVMLYEYIDKAGPMSVNGYPTFFSMGHLNAEEKEKMIFYYLKVKESMDAI